MNKFMISIGALLASSAAYGADDPVIEAMREYMEFAEYAEGSISADQLASIDGKDVVFVDTRNKGQFDAGHIPGARHIEWREILARRDEIPTDRPVVLYCETGILSSKAQFALSVAGRDNVKVLWGGFLMWSARQSFEEAQKKATKGAK